MTAQYDVAAIGSAIVDIICKCDDDLLDALRVQKGQMRLVDQAEFLARVSKRCRIVTELAGGSAANTAVGLTSLGGQASFIGRVADDDFGRIFKHDINRIGVAFSTRPAPSMCKETSRSLVLVTPDGQRTMLTFLGCSAEFHQGLIEPAVIENARFVLLEGYLFDQPQAQAAFYRAAALAKRAGRKVALTLCDPACVNRHRSDIFALIRSGVELLIANEREIMALFDARRFEDTIAPAGRLVSTCALTRSGRGSVIVSKGEVTLVPAEGVSRVVDTTGAGDLYASGLIFGLAHGMDIAASGRLASFAAAEIIGQMGARPQAQLEGLARMRGLLQHRQLPQHR
jgi:sugar/nucleoside kinase (ribokinase family)